MQPDSEDIHLQQVGSGMAWNFKKYQREHSPADRIRYSDAECEARRHKLGLWHDPNPMPRRDYWQTERDQRKIHGAVRWKIDGLVMENGIRMTGERPDCPGDRYVRCRHSLIRQRRADQRTARSVRKGQVGRHG